MPKRLVAFLLVLCIPATIAVGLIISEKNSAFSLIFNNLRISSHGEKFVNRGSPLIDAGSCEVTGLCAPPVTQSTTTSVLKANARVVRVIDGDTFVTKLDAEAEEWTVRMLGINTPETVDPRRPVECFGKEASAALGRLIEGKRIRLEADSQADERDKYGRLLRNVFLEDGTDVNARLVREGYAHAYLSYPLDPHRKKELRELQAFAKASSSGLWSSDACPVQS